MNAHVYEQMGIASMIPGLQHAVEIMQGHLDTLRSQLTMLQSGRRIPGRVGRPSKMPQLASLSTPDSLPVVAKPRKKHRTNQWASMTAEERKAEGQRRMAVALANRSKSKAQVAKERYARANALRQAKASGEKAKPLAKQSSLSRAAKAKDAWAGMTPEERSKEMKRRMAVAKRNKRAATKKQASAVIPNGAKANGAVAAEA